MKILHLDTNHPLLIEQLDALGFENHEDYNSDIDCVKRKVHSYDGLVIRSRFKIDRDFLQAAENLKFIGRVGSGLENIDLMAADEMGVKVFGAPEGNCNAVGEHAMGLLLNLFNNIRRSDREVRKGVWKREANRGLELEGKTIGIIGYGHTGKAFAKKLSGFDCEVLCHDIIPGLGDQYAKQVEIEDIREKADVLSFHVPLTELTDRMLNKGYIEAFTKPFWFINTARGRNVMTSDLVDALENGTILGAGLDVLEYEKLSFENLDDIRQLPEPFQYLVKSDRVILTPHIAGWTHESKRKLAKVIVDKIKLHIAHD
ncbi:MAG: 2-hydroxyacid dehydrogenase [Bacteroidia bacterium]|nr:2-hydroxyacid dehydrogenase [Bacteroidia bacterium]